MKKILGAVLAMGTMVLSMMAFFTPVKAAESGTTIVKETAKSVDIVFGGGDLYVESWDQENFGFKVELGENSNGYDYKCYVKNNILYVEGSQKSGHSPKKGDNKVYLYIPANKKLEDFNITNGNADSQIKNIDCRKLQVETSVGTVNLKEFATVDAGIVMGSGIINAEGDIIGNVDAFCGGGTVNIKLKGTIEDHDYTFETMFGKIRIGDVTYGIMSKEKINNNSNSKIDLECISGKINLDFINQ